MYTLLIINVKLLADPRRWRRAGSKKTCWAAFIVWMRHTCLGKCRWQTIPRPQSRVNISRLQEKGKMLKKLFHAFLLSVAFSLALYVLLLSFSSSHTIYLSPSRKDGLLDVLQQQVDTFWKERTGKQITRGAVRLLHTTLGSCPETPPGLVGPLRVEFDFNRTWHDVRKELGISLQRGGRYKPPDCVSNHKVGNFNKRANGQKILL